MKTKLFNDIEEMYKEGIIELKDYNPIEYKCSVCGKEYKRKKLAENHISKRNCHSYRQVFEGSPAESKFYSLYKTSCAIEDKRGYGFRKFKKSPLYTHYAKWYIFCLNNNLNDINNFYEYVICNVSGDSVVKKLIFSMKESVLKDYFQFRRHGVDSIRSERFFNMYSNHITTDITFVLRSLERGDIELTYLFEQLDADEFIDKLNTNERYRFETFLKSITTPS